MPNIISNEEMLEELIGQKELPQGFVAELCRRMLLGLMNGHQVAAGLALLRIKTERAEYLSEAAQILLDQALALERPDYACGDIVGTGGDGQNTINISTMASLVAASSGVPMIKHGSVSASSKCGSADVLHELGVNISLKSAQNRLCLDQNNWCFLFAPIYHPYFLAVKEIRQQLKIKTLFNILGPLVNPWLPRATVLGVYHPRLIKPFVETLKKLGRHSALVVHGSGLDEIALHGPTSCALLKNHEISYFTLGPEDLGCKNFALETIKGSDTASNARDFQDILAGKSSEAKLSMVSASAGALLWLYGQAENLKSGVEMARTTLESGKALKTLQKIREFSRASANHLA